MRPQIALFEDVRTDAAKICNAARGHMVRPAIAEQQDVGDPVLLQEIIEKDRPVAKTAAEVGRGFRPIDDVASADVDPLHLDAPARIVSARRWSSGPGGPAGTETSVARCQPRENVA